MVEEEVIMLVPPGSTALEDHTECAYREAKIMVSGDVKRLTSYKQPIRFSEGCDDAMRLGAHGKPMKVGNIEDYCKECQVGNLCEYGSPDSFENFKKRCEEKEAATKTS